jgi:hypothetical protein
VLAPSSLVPLYVKHPVAPDNCFAAPNGWAADAAELVSNMTESATPTAAQKRLAARRSTIMLKLLSTLDKKLVCTCRSISPPAILVPCGAEYESSIQAVPIATTDREPTYVRADRQGDSGHWPKSASSSLAARPGSDEPEYFQHGGILQYVLARLLAEN